VWMDTDRVIQLPSDGNFWYMVSVGETEGRGGELGERGGACQAMCRSLRCTLRE
jgi:hypothetical protein